jgi:hypothetical protein
MTTRKKQASSQKKEKPSSRCEMRQDDLERTLSIIKDYFDRAMCPFLLLGETGHAVYYEEGLSGHQLEIGVKPTALTQYAVSTLKNFIDGFGTADNKVGFNVGTIPVSMYILRRDADVFKYPDQRFYDQDIYFVPNPFVKYYKNREYFE